MSWAWRWCSRGTATSATSVHCAFHAIGARVAGRELDIAALVELLRDRTCVVLDPANSEGWFGGTRLIVWDPVERGSRVSMERAGSALDDAFRGKRAGITVALLEYDGVCHWACFEGGLIETGDGWHVWGGAPVDTHALVQAATAERVAPLSASAPLLANAEWSTTPAEYRASIDAVRASIADGDVYVVNLTAMLSGSLETSMATCVATLRARTAAMMSATVAGLEDEGGWLVSASPERFIELRADGEGVAASIHPIKGTRPRGADADEDEALALDLLQDAKEHAEHVMVVDLERNDLGRVSVPGTVRVDPLARVLPTPYCHQMVSAVHSRLRAGVGVSEVLAATFPCGSITGAPKAAAIASAAMHERISRGVYCGSLAVAAKGVLDSSVLIRTLHADAAGNARWGAGCGITIESRPEAEYLEMLLKATPITGDDNPAVGLREMMLVVDGSVPFLDYHLARLARGGCGPSVLARVRGAVAAAETRPGCRRLGVSVSPSGAVSTELVSAPSSLDIAGGVRIGCVEVSAPPALPLGCAKPLDRTPWDRALAEARTAGADQAVLITSDGHIVDGTTATLWVVFGQRLETPPSPPAVAGVAREVVFDIARRLGLEVEEAPLTVLDLDQADEVFLTNAIAGPVAVRGRSGPVVETLARAWRERAIHPLIERVRWY